VRASDVPRETGLHAQAFAAAKPGQTYTSPSDAASVWRSPGPVREPITVALNDGSRVTYSWYRFVDQPALQHLHLDAAQKEKLQALIVRIHSHWPVTRDYMPPPTRGSLAEIESALIVSPPKGLEVGYVPIVTRQEADPSAKR